MRHPLSRAHLGSIRRRHPGRTRDLRERHPGQSGQNVEEVPLRIGGGVRVLRLPSQPRELILAVGGASPACASAVWVLAPPRRPAATASPISRRRAAWQVGQSRPRGRLRPRSPGTGSPHSPHTGHGKVAIPGAGGRWRRLSREVRISGSTSIGAASRGRCPTARRAVALCLDRLSTVGVDTSYGDASPSMVATCSTTVPVDIRRTAWPPPVGDSSGTGCESPLDCPQRSPHGEMPGQRTCVPSSDLRLALLVP